jgi:outer membrane protein assembly factor BamA
MRIPLILCLSLVLTHTSLIAQKNYFAQYQYVDTTNDKSLTLEKGFINKTLCANYINGLTQSLRNKGYIAASVDTVFYGTDTAKVSLYIGALYQWLHIDVSKNEPEVLLLSGWDDKNQKKGILNFDRLYALQQKMLNYYQENGYPFAKIQLDSIAINNNQITASLITTKGNAYLIDSIKLFGTAKIANIFLQKHLSIKDGSRYKKSLLDAIPKKIQQLPYLQEQYPYNLTMLAASAVVNVYLQPRKSSIINVLLGLIPQPNPNGLSQVASSKLFLSGDANILLNNMMGLGETIGLNYQQLSINSRRINLLYKHPFVFKSNYSVDAMFELYKRDSSYLNIDAQLGATYNLAENTTGRLFVQLNKTNTFPDTARMRSTKKLPDNLDVKIYNLGFQYDRNTTDFRRNPRKGNEINISTSFGTKKIIVNSAVSTLKDPSFNYTSLYDSIKKSTYQLKLKLAAAHYFKLRKQTVLKTALQSGVLLSQNYLKNELFQIGGFKILRGFDEESQFCNQYAVVSAEYRYLIASESYFFLFTDAGYTGNSVANKINHTYFGTGLGLNFTTKAGMFNMSFAVGTRNDIPLGFKQAKLHFGYVNVF